MSNVDKKKKDSKLKENFKDLGKIIKKGLYIAGHSILSFIKKYRYLIILDIIIFILTVFIEPLYMYKIGAFWRYLNTALFILIPTIIFCLLKYVKSHEIVISIPIFYLFFLIFIDYCTLRDLYGITSGSLDNIPNYIDALFTVFIFTLLEYLPAFIIKAFQPKKKIKKVEHNTKEK